MRTKPSAEWRPLFYRILENGIRDLQRRRSVRKRFMTWLPGPKEDPDNEAQDPLDSVADTAPAVPETVDAGSGDAEARSIAARIAGAPARGVHAAQFRRLGCRRDGNAPWAARKAASRRIIRARCIRCANNWARFGDERAHRCGAGNAHWKSAAGRCSRKVSTASTCARARGSRRLVMPRSTQPALLRAVGRGFCACRSGHSAAGVTAAAAARRRALVRRVRWATTAR